jgi:regulator of sirC expression with transglutaminase-like and TPR domain
MRVTRQAPMTVEAKRRESVVGALRAVGTRADRDIPLAETALLLAALDRPDADLARYHQHLAELATRAAERATRADSVGMQIAALNAVLIEHFGYAGDAETYDDLRNASLIDVIDRRRGLPVALGILYIHAARSYGGEIVGLSFPSHFLLRISGRGQRAIIDPFNRGHTLSAADLRGKLKELQGANAELQPHHHAPVGNRDVLIRLQNNIKVRAVAAGELARAVAVLDALTLIAPEHPELWWELAVLHSRLGNLRTAITTLEGYLAAAEPAAGTAKLEDLLRRLRSRVN